MFLRNLLIFSLLSTHSIWAETTSIDLNDLDGNWHLRVMNGMEVRKARAILDFDAKKMEIHGFDGCNRIMGRLQGNDKHMTSQLMTTRMACRESIHTYVSQNLHKAISEGFSIIEEEKYGIEGITLKSPNYELFFKRMGKEKGWF